MEQQQPPISDYGFLSDSRSGALVGKDGSVDWWCPHRFDGSSVFARLLDPRAGHFRLAPVGVGGPGFRVERAYLPDSLVLRTVHHTPHGSVAVVDALAAEVGARAHELGKNSPAVLIRVVQGISGRVRMALDFAPRPEYGLLTPYLHEQPDGGVLAGAGPVVLVLRAGGLHLRAGIDRVTHEFEVSAGQVIGMDLAFGEAYGDPPARVDPLTTLAETTQAWQAFRETHGYSGRYPELVKHSSTVLTGLTYARSGAVAAALTSSLPEQIGGDRNYDYRYSWLRDFSLTMRALWVAACPDETSRLFAWATRSIGRFGDEPVPVLFGLEGERDISEHHCSHLRGYRDSRPVRVGNDAWRQRQLDVPGEVMSAVWRLRDYLGATFDGELCEMVLGLTEQVASTWQMPDRGIWETRDEERHYVSSKVSCWLTMDRAVGLADRLGDRADPRRWARVRDEIRDTVLREGWNDRIGAFTGAFGSAELDASVLALPVTHFLPATDPRMRSTIAMVERELGTEDGLLRRWTTDPAGFLLCSFWLVECLVMTGEQQRAEALFERVVGYSNDVGLFSEQIDLSTGMQLGNTPQALSHIGLINAAWRITRPDSY
ncbi:glycoside hydrolase family 15 protein [Micromonospora parathelypteridis]|uniref:GH15 family glucan-1,4-alpha-glucosidase n=1 Tax=Micromonospora parathelypteridis TaxID=1839617 RepID=A0A840VZR9_9ACTN|nr:glycoside hydrolase family 15 protein [Micromonospora parathelypteridis]MBB5479354.1 GH15 family glucan-1,4-alpha-glucosidase [Micromonospora parathelypteridis]GGO01727.1 glucoamylase [Micromonospora parathelypteridis]